MSKQRTGGFATVQLTFGGVRPDKVKPLLAEVSKRLGLIKGPEVVPGANNRDNVIVHARYPKEGSVWGAWPSDLRTRAHAAAEAVGTKPRIHEENYKRHETMRRSKEELCA
jgi:hypothetical protein